MALSDVLEHIDSEIARLQQARALLSGMTEAVPAVKGKRGRPKGSKNTAAASEPETGTPAKKAKRKISPEGRKAIADAMKRRWAERRKQSPK